MEWERSTLKRWTANGYRITEAPDEPPTRGFRLDLPDPDAEPIFFPGPDAAKTHASLLHELELFRADNAQLRAELEALNQAEIAELDAEAEEARLNGEWSSEPSTGAAPTWEGSDMDRAIDAVVATQRAEAKTFQQAGDHDPWLDGDQRGIPPLAP